jgi:prophage maintenance system killer protein
MTQQEPWASWITNERVHSLYADGIEKWGGTGSPSKNGCVDGALGAAYNAELYSMPEMDSETIVSGLHFCAYILFYLTQNNCFLDGNKRVGWASCMYVLLGLGVTVEATDDEVEQLCLSIADGSGTKPTDIVIWIAQRLKSIN